MSGNLLNISATNSAATSSTDLKIEQSNPLFTSKLLDCTSKKNEEQDIEGENMGLEPVDGGKAAWLFMVGAVIIDAIIWGEQEIRVHDLGTPS